MKTAGSELLKEGERLDDLQREGFYLIQNPEYFCFGMDAVLLAGYANTGKEEKVLDLCCGNGIIPVLLCARNKTVSVTGLEIRPEGTDLARRSAMLNGLSDRTSFLTGDIREAARIIPPASFHVVTANPPYMKGGSGLKNPDSILAQARHEVTCSLNDVVAAAAHALRGSGRFYMVHRPHRLAEIFETLNRHHLEPKRMRLVFPYADKEPNMVLIEARKGGRSGMRVEKPLIVYESPGVYTKEVYEIYGMSPDERRAQTE